MALFANALPKLAGLTFLVVWGTQGGQIPLERVGVVFGALALFEALTAAAVEKQRAVLEWSDLGAVLRGLLRPAALPLYAVLVAGVFFLGGEPPDHGRRMGPTGPSERSTLPPRIVPTPRSTPSGFTPGTPARPGTPGGPPINYAPKAPTAPGGTSIRPTFTPSRPPSPAPTANPAPQPPAPVRAVPPSTPTATAAPTPAPAPASGAAPK